MDDETLEPVVGQAETAALNMVHGIDTPHQDVQVLCTTQFRQVLKTAGERAAADTAQITSGSLGERSAVVTFGCDGRLVASFAVNQSKWLPYYRAQIEVGAAFSLEDLTVVPAADTRLSSAR